MNFKLSLKILLLFFIFILILMPVSASDTNQTDINYEYNQSTYFGGSGNDNGYGIEVDNQGNIYIAMDTNSPNLFVSNNAYQKTLKGGSDLYIAKFSPNGELIHGTYIGGSQNDRQKDFTIDSNGNVYITGYTLSSDLPTTNNALSRTFNGVEDAYVIVVSSDFSKLIYGSYLKGALDDRAYSIKLDKNLNVYVSGYTNSLDFQITSNAYQKFKKGINWTSGSINDITFQNSFDCFVSKININTGALEYSTYFGGEYADYSYGALDIDDDGLIYIAGSTNSLEIPVTSNAFSTHSSGDFDYFVSVINNTQLVYSTYIGGKSADEPHQLIVSGDSVYILGDTLSVNFPTTSNAYKSVFGENNTMDGSIIKFNKSSWSIIYSTLLGGNNDEDLTRMVVDEWGNVYVTGFTVSTDYPVTSNAYKKVKSGSDFISSQLSDDYDNFCYDCIISKISSDGSKLLYSTYYGANHGEYGQGIALYGNGFIVNMQVWSDNLRTNENSYQKNHNNDKVSNSVLKRGSIYRCDMYWVCFTYDDRVSTYFDVDDVVMIYGEDNSFKGKLLDVNNSSIAGKHLSLNLTRLSSGLSKVYDVVTDYDGVFNLDINLASGYYMVSSFFGGDGFYSSAVKPVNLKIFESNVSNMSTVLFLDYFDNVVGSGSKFTGHLYDLNLNPLPGQKIAVNITRSSSGLSKLYYVTSNYLGEFVMDINLATGFYPVFCSFDGFNGFSSSECSGSLTIRF